MTIPKINHDLSKRDIHKLVGKNDPLILEIGAHDGGDSKAFLNEFAGITLHCFEPDPRVSYRHETRIKDSRCTLHKIAIGAKSGTATLYQSDGHPDTLPDVSWDCSSSIRRPTDSLHNAFPWMKFDQTVEVTVISLDEFMMSRPEISAIDFVWADVQGAEIDLIQGGRHSLATKTRYLYTEFCDAEWYEGEITLTAILALLPEFEPLGIYENNVLMKNRSL